MRCVSSRVLGWTVSLAAFVLPVSVSASARITEIMYDLPGTDTGREWLEVENTGSEGLSLAQWKFFEANTNHGISLFQGNATTSAGGFAIIADDPAKFLADNPSYSGTLFGSSFSLSNTGETLELKFKNASIFQVSYVSSAGAAGDGNSLQLVNGVWQAAAPTPGAVPGGSAASGAISSSTPASTAGDAATTTEQTAPEPPSPPANKGGSAWTFTPQMYVSALAPTHGVAGAPLFFDAVAVGAKKESIPNARFVWSFGDGGAVEGKRVQHTYHYPASYVVMVTAASGEWNATDRKEVMIAAPALVIAEVREGATGFIEVRNDGKNDIDLSQWMLVSGSGLFTFPPGTVIAARKSIPFPAAITGLSADSASTALLYPTGSAAVSYREQSVEPEPLLLTPEERPAIIATVAESKPDTTVVVTPPMLPKETAAESAPAPEQTEKEPPALPTDSHTVLLGAVGAAQTPSERTPPDSVSGRRLSEVGALPGGNAAEVGGAGKIFPWLGGAALLALLAAGGYVVKLLSERAPNTAEILRKEAEEYDLVE